MDINEIIDLIEEGNGCIARTQLGKQLLSLIPDNPEAPELRTALDEKMRILTATQNALVAVATQLIVDEPAVTGGPLDNLPLRIERMKRDLRLIKLIDPNDKDISSIEDTIASHEKLLEITTGNSELGPLGMLLLGAMMGAKRT